MLLSVDTRYSDEQQLRRDDLRNQLLSLNNDNNNRIEPDHTSNVWDSLPGSKWGSCTDLLNGPKSRSLPKALQPKSPKDEQRSLSFSYRAPVLALPRTLPLTKAPRPFDNSGLYENQRHSTQRSRLNSFGGFSSQALSSAPSRVADKDPVGANYPIRMSNHKASPARCVTSHPVTLQRPESPCGTKSPSPGTAQAHAQMLWIEKVRRGSDSCSEYTSREPFLNNNAKETYRNDPNRGPAGTHIEMEPRKNSPVKESYSHHVQEERSRNSTAIELHLSSQEKEQRWNDANKKQHWSQKESEPYYNTGLDLRLSYNGKAPENESHWNNGKNESRYNYAGTETRRPRDKEPYWKKPATEQHVSYTELETGWNNPEKERGLAILETEPRCKSPAKDLSWSNNKNESHFDKREKYSSHLNRVDSDTVWMKPETQPSLRNSSEMEPLRNSKEKEPICSDTENEQHWNKSCKRNPFSSHIETESHRNIVANGPHRNGEERIQRWNKDSYLTSNGSQWNNPEKESNWKKKIMEPHWTNSEENRYQKLSVSTILPSLYTHTSPSAGPCISHPSSRVEPTTLYPQRPPMAQQQTSSGDDLRLMTSPLYKLSSFRYGSGGQSPSGVHQNDEGRGRDSLPRRTPFDGKATDFQTSGRASRDRALSQGAFPRLLNRYISGSAVDLSRGFDDPRGSSERTPPRTSEGRIPSGTNQIPSSTKQISDRWRTMDRAQGTSNNYITGSSGQSLSALYKTRNRWASLDREGESQKESRPRRTDQSGPDNIAQRTKDRRTTFEPRNPVTENTFRKREDSARPASCIPAKQTLQISTTEGLDRETTYSKHGSGGYPSPISRCLYGSETNLTSLSSRQDPSYLAMTSSKYPSGRSNGQDNSQNETMTLSSPMLNQAQSTGTSAPHHTSSVQLMLMPQRPDFNGATSNDQSEDVTRSTSVSSFNQVEPTTESNNGNRTYTNQFPIACDSKSVQPYVSSKHGLSREPTRVFGSTVAVTAYPFGETKTQMSDGNLTEDSGIGFSENNIRSSSASPKDDLKLNREIMIDEGRLTRGAPVYPTTSDGPVTLNYPPPFVGQSIEISPPRYSETDYVRKRRNENEENNYKEIFTKEDWISSARKTGKSPIPVENKTLNVASYDRRMEVLSREANTRSSDISAPTGVWRAQLDDREANTRKDGRTIANTEQPVRQDNLNAVPPKSTAEKWKEFLSGSVEIESPCKVLQDQQDKEWRREGTIAIGESLGQVSGGQWKVDPQWTTEEGSSVQLPVGGKEISRASRATVKESVFGADEVHSRRKGNLGEDFVVSKASLERQSTSEKSSVQESSNMEDRMRRDGKIEDTLQGGKGNERNMENCNGEVQGLREVEIHVQRGALGVGFCVEGGLQSTAGDRPITIKRIFAGAYGHLRGKLRTGDEILRVNDKDFRQMSHYNAWNFLKTLPEGPAKLLIFAK